MLHGRRNLRTGLVMVIVAALLTAMVPTITKAQYWAPWVQFAGVDDEGSRGLWEAWEGNCTSTAYQLVQDDWNMQLAYNKLTDAYGEPTEQARCFWTERYNWDYWDDNDGSVLLWTWHVPNEVVYDVDGYPIYNVYPPGTTAGIIWVRSAYYGWTGTEAVIIGPDGSFWVDEVAKFETPNMPGKKSGSELLKLASAFGPLMKNMSIVKDAVYRPGRSSAKLRPAISLSYVGNSEWMNFWVFNVLPFQAWAYDGYNWARYVYPYMIPESVKLNSAGFFSCMLLGNNNGQIGLGSCPYTAIAGMFIPIYGPAAAVGACATAGVMCTIGNLNVKWKQ